MVTPGAEAHTQERCSRHPKRSTVLRIVFIRFMFCIHKITQTIAENKEMWVETKIVDGIFVDYVVFSYICTYKTHTRHKRTACNLYKND